MPTHNCPKNLTIGVILSISKKHLRIYWPLVYYLRNQVIEFANTDIYKALDNERNEKNEIKEKYSDLVGRFNENVNEYNELLEENSTLKERMKDLKSEIGLLYQNTKEFLRGRAESVRAFKNDFNDFIGDLREKIAGSEFERLYKREKSREKDRGVEKCLEGVFLIFFYFGFKPDFALEFGFELIFGDEGKEGDYDAE